MAHNPQRKEVVYSVTVARTQGGYVGAAHEQSLNGKHASSSIPCEYPQEAARLAIMQLHKDDLAMKAREAAKANAAAQLRLS